MSIRTLTGARVVTLVACAAAVAATLSCRSASRQQTFASPEDAAKALIEVAKRGTLDDLMKILGPDAQPLVDASDPTTARQHRDVFVVAAAEGLRLVDNGPDGRVLVVGHESWPFPVPLVKDANRWRFDTAAGIEEVMARRIGRNELAAIRACRTYVLAQKLYARRGHDGKQAGLYATVLRSDPGRHNGLYWPAARGEKRSPLGDLIADSSNEAQSPFHGYHFRILPPREPNGFALVAWPATYDATGVMTFVVNQDGLVSEKDLGPDTDRVAGAMTVYNPDKTWDKVE
jgi:Protein of unknown function (DUF2950)